MNRRLILTVSTLALGLSGVGAWASQPPDPVGSDSAGNTAMGANALQDLSGGNSNTAAGQDSLTEVIANRARRQQRERTWQ